MMRVVSTQKRKALEQVRVRILEIGIRLTSRSRELIPEMR